MQNWKFESLLNEESLFFCRADKFDDPFEGFTPKKVVEGVKSFYKKYPWSQGNLSESQIETTVHSLINTQKLMRNSFLINCWQKNEYESNIMWQEYVGDIEGIAIRTSYEKFEKAFSSTNENIYIGKIRYIDFEKEHWYHEKEYPHPHLNAFIPYVHKRKQFSQEMECRALVQLSPEKGFQWNWDKENSENGKLIKVDLNQLIEEVIVSPKASDKYLKSVERLLDKKGLNVKVSQSELSRIPNY